MDYWEECISEACEDAGLEITREQIDTIASWVEGAHDNYSMAHGHDCIPNPLSYENDQLKRDLKRQENKTICENCNGKGSETSYGPVHCATSECYKCRGEGFIFHD